MKVELRDLGSRCLMMVFGYLDLVGFELDFIIKWLIIFFIYISLN